MKAGKFWIISHLMLIFSPMLNADAECPTPCLCISESVTNDERLQAEENNVATEAMLSSARTFLEILGDKLKPSYLC